MNPVQSVIREHVDAHFAEWSGRVEAPVPTRAGPRYFGVHVASLLAPALKAVGLYLHEETGVRTFVTSDGRQITREALVEQLTGALNGHEDAVLRASIASPSFWEHLSYRTPEYEGPVRRALIAQRSDRPTSSTESTRLHRNRTERAERASALAFLAKVAPRIVGERHLGQDLYAVAVANIERRAGEEIAPGDDLSEFFAVPRRGLFYEVADAVFGPRRRSARGGVYDVPEDVEEVLARVARIVAGMRLAPETVEALTLVVEALTGDTPEPFDLEDETDRLIARIGPPHPPTNPHPALAKIAEALPVAVANAVAIADDPRKDFRLMCKAEAARRPETRPAIMDAARAFGPDLVEHIRYRVACAIAEEARA